MGTGSRLSPSLAMADSTGVLPTSVHCSAGGRAERGQVETGTVQRKRREGARSGASQRAGNQRARRSSWPLQNFGRVPTCRLCASPSACPVQHTCTGPLPSGDRSSAYMSAQPDVLLPPPTMNQVLPRIAPAWPASRRDQQGKCRSTVLSRSSRCQTISQTVMQPCVRARPHLVILPTRHAPPHPAFICTCARWRHRPLPRRLAPLQRLRVQAVQLVVAVRHRAASKYEEVAVAVERGGVRGARARPRACCAAGSTVAAARR